MPPFRRPRAEDTSDLEDELNALAREQREIADYAITYAQNALSRAYAPDVVRSVGDYFHETADKSDELQERKKEIVARMQEIDPDRVSSLGWDAILD
ncbi:hypothetical protein [Rhodomicrobium lacus]|uniref:hypothetical protein n=1 Tax=Rhodomicrobium lacus TaxID=2498452 RepID=UPI000F8EF9FA|nr:hypothetical protein [Rhodomicrobium lacus]